MLTQRETETIRAALQFWREEICPHGEATARLYLDADDVSPLNSDEVEKLRDQFARSAQGIALGNRAKKHFGSPERAKQNPTRLARSVSPCQGWLVVNQ